MKIQTPVSPERLRTHFTYSWWKYAVMALAVIFGWNLIYVQTTYRPPQDKRIDVYIKSATVTQGKADAFLTQAWQSAVPDMELVDSVIMTSSGDDYYGTMQLSVYIMAGEGDVYILPAQDFKNFAAQGAFLPLEDLVASGTIITDGMDLSAGYVAVQEDEAETSTQHLYGIPMDSLYGFMDGMQLDNRGMFLCIMVAGGNDQNTIPFVSALIAQGRGEKPSWVQ
jgi:hypothetical protein